MLLVKPDASDQVELPNHLKQLDQIVPVNINVHRAAERMGAAPRSGAGPDFPVMLRAAIAARDDQGLVVELPDFHHLLHEVRVHEEPSASAMALQLLDGEIFPSAGSAQGFISLRISLMS